MNTKQKKKLNIVDIIIALTLLALVTAAAIGLFRGLSTTGEKVTVKYVMEISPIDQEFTSKVVEGQAVFNYSDSSNIGKISAVATSQAYHTGTDSQGSVVSSPIEGKSTLHLTVTATATKVDTGYAVDNTVISIGKHLDLRLPNLYCTGKCVSLEIVE